MPDAQLIRCPACGANNRVAAEKLQQGLQPRCGQCKTPLARRPAPRSVTDSTFAAQVEQSDLPVLVDAWAPWCGPCRMIAPIIDELAQEMDGQVRFVKINVDENPVMSDRFKIRSIPCLLLFRGGREVDRMVGVQSKAEIKRRLQKVATA